MKMRNFNKQSKMLFVLSSITVFSQLAFATTYLSVSPIPNVNALPNKEDLTDIEAQPYGTRESWSRQLLTTPSCDLVNKTITALHTLGLIPTITDGKEPSVLAGGFEGVTDPTYVFELDDDTPQQVTDINVFANALGYVLNQGSTAQFNKENATNYDNNGFPIPYADVIFSVDISGETAANFFASLGKLGDANPYDSLYSGKFAGFTQIDGTTLTFLKPNSPLQKFTCGLYKATLNTPQTNPPIPKGKYDPRVSDQKIQPKCDFSNGTEIPSTYTASVAFFSGDWKKSNGQQYLDFISATTGGTVSTDSLEDALQPINEAHRNSFDDAIAGTAPNCSVPTP